MYDFLNFLFSTWEARWSSIRPTYNGRSISELSSIISTCIVQTPAVELFLFVVVRLSVVKLKPKTTQRQKSTPFKLNADE